MGDRTTAGRWRRFAALTLLVPLATPLTVAHAATAVPRPGQCFMFTSAVLESMSWPTAATPVPCTAPHTFEVTRTGTLAKDVNARYYAQQQCPDEGVWSDAGVNQPVNGLIASPLRVEGYWFVVGTDSFACGAAVRAFHGRKAATAEPLSSRIRELDEEQLAELRFCSKAANGRDVARPPISVSCQTRPRWEVTHWVNWSEFFADFPGVAALRARAKELCPEGARFSYPDEKRWAEGTPRTWCYTLVTA